MHRAAFAWTRPSLLTCAGTTATILQNTTGSPIRIRRVPPMTSAGRKSPPGSPPFRSGVTRSASRTATITPRPRRCWRHPAKRGRHAREAPVAKSE